MLKSFIDNIDCSNFLGKHFSFYLLLFLLLLLSDLGSLGYFLVNGKITTTFFPAYICVQSFDVSGKKVNLLIFCTVQMLSLDRRVQQLFLVVGSVTETMLTIWGKKNFMFRCLSSTLWRRMCIVANCMQRPIDLKHLVFDEMS